MRNINVFFIASIVAACSGGADDHVDVDAAVQHVDSISVVTSADHSVNPLVADVSVDVKLDLDLSGFVVRSYVFVNSEAGLFRDSKLFFDKLGHDEMMYTASFDCYKVTEILAGAYVMSGADVVAWTSAKPIITECN